MNIIPSHQDEILFEPRDTEIFKIPDIKTKIATVQNYFFPRLEHLLRETLYMVAKIYDINPYEHVSFVYRPSNRKTAKENYDFAEVYIGISGKKSKSPLRVKRENGSNFFYHPTYIIYRISLDGDICVELRPFVYYIDKQFVSTMGKLFQENLDALLPIFALQNIGYHCGIIDIVNLVDLFIYKSAGMGAIRFYSPTYYFPIDIEHGLRELMMVFATLYPVLEASILLAEGKEPRLKILLEKYKAFWLSSMSRIYTEDHVSDDAYDEQQDISIRHYNNLT